MAPVTSAVLWALPLFVWQVTALYNPIREYAGETFFNQFAYYGNVDNTTWGNVTYVDQPTAVQQGLTFINGAGNAIVKVDNTTTIAPAPIVNRNSIRLTSLDSYGEGSLIIIDAVHIPFGCSVWPAFWTYGIEETWPAAGEIDIIEAINNMDNNQVALHTTPGCFQADLTGLNAQTGHSNGADCSTASGCVVAETKPDSFGPGFATAGGGVFALQIDSSGIFSWFWGRADIPADILSATSTSQVDTTTWGLPTAAYPNTTCDIDTYFPPQNLVLLTTLCGVWAGVPSIYRSTCHTPTNDCVADNVIGDGSNYADAFWEIRYIRAYLADTVTTTSSAPSSTASVLSYQTNSAPAVVTSVTTLTSSIPTPSTSTTMKASSAASISTSLRSVVLVSTFWVVISFVL